MKKSNIFKAVAFVMALCIMMTQNHNNFPKLVFAEKSMEQVTSSDNTEPSSNSDTAQSPDEPTAADSDNATATEETPQTQEPEETNAPTTQEPQMLMPFSASAEIVDAVATDFSSLQIAIANAENNGGTQYVIDVQDNIVFPNAISMTKPVNILFIGDATLTAESSRHFTIQNVAGMNQPVTLNFGNIILEGDETGSGICGGIYDMRANGNSGDLTINGGAFQNCKTTNSTYGLGGAIQSLCTSNTLTLNDATIKGCYAGFAGGGIYAKNDTVINNCVITNNEAGNWYSAVETSGNLTITNNSDIRNNKSGSGNMPAIYSYKNLTVEHSKISGNDGGALRVGGSATNVTTIKYSEISDNTSTSGGTGIYVDGGSIVLENATVTNNNGQGKGIGINCRNGANAPATIRITNSKINDNVSTNGSGSGAGISVESLKTSTIIIGSEVNRNINNGSSGGGIYTPGSLVVQDSTFDSNKSTNVGGAIHSGNLEIYNSVIINNVGNSQGGAIYGTGTISIYDNSVLTNNKSTGSSGGALYSASSITITDSTLSDNEASLYGGAIYYSSILTITNSTFKSNKSTKDGGAIYAKPWLSNPIVTTIVNSKLIDNTAGANGGAIYMPLANLAQVTVDQGTVFSGNTAAFGRAWTASNNNNSYAVLHNTNILATEFSSSFTNAYNNYDINFSPYIVKFVTNGGMSVADQPVSAGKPLDGSLISTVRSDYSFVGWFTDPGLTTPFNVGTDAVNDNITLYATWQAIPVPSPSSTASPEPTASVAPTSTSAPISTSEPTSTSAPTATSAPTSTSAPISTSEPTSTSAPTATSASNKTSNKTPVSTQTPEPTQTPVSTQTPEPNATLVPTQTPEPTATLVPTNPTPTPAQTSIGSSGVTYATPSIPSVTVVQDDQILQEVVETNIPDVSPSLGEKSGYVKEVKDEQGNIKWIAVDENGLPLAVSGNKPNPKTGDNVGYCFIYLLTGLLGWRLSIYYASKRKIKR